jgi:hypothetical protein
MIYQVNSLRGFVKIQTFTQRQPFFINVAIILLFKTKWNVIIILSNEKLNKLFMI